jgi:hypothetical protein
MKYLSLVIILALMSWTWCLATTPRDFSLENYQVIEMEFEKAIREHIKARRPDAKNIIFHQLYTEKAQPNGDVRARFRYEIDANASGGESTEEIIEGVAVRHSEDEGATWSWRIEEAKSPSVRFREGIKVTPKSESTPESSSENSTETTTETPVTAPHTAPEGHSK